MDKLLQWQPDKIEAIGDRELKKFESYLNLVLSAIMAIANDSEVIIQAPKDLNLDTTIEERISLWELSNSIDRTSKTVKKLDIEEARSLVIVICYLAQQHQQLLRKAVSLLEAIEPSHPPQTALLGNYFDRFVKYGRGIIFTSDVHSESLSNLAWKLLTDLLFYSGKNGHHLLWLAMLETAREDYN